MVVSNCDSEHNHSVNKENILALQAVAEVKDKMSDIIAHSLNMVVYSLRLLQPFQTLLWFLCSFSVLKKATNNDNTFLA